VPDHDDTGCVSSAPVSPFHFALRSFGAAIATVYRWLVLADVDPCRLVLLLDALNELHSWQVLRRSGRVPASGYQTKRPPLPNGLKTKRPPVCSPMALPFLQQVCVEPPTSARNVTVTLPVFAAERRRRLLQHGVRSCLAISPASRTHSSKLAAADLLL